MGRVSLELVPRSEESFTVELEEVRERFSCIDTLNIPDILKFDMRIPEACRVAAPFFSNIIPHIRAVSVHREKPLPFKRYFQELGIKEALVILGDNPEIVSESEMPCDSPGLIRKIKKEMPGVKVYAGIDQWRTTIEEEIAYAGEKIDAGADGFFTQPFFDIDHMRKWGEHLTDTEIFWGVAPVIRESSRKYWENKNKVVFPENFACSMEWNKDFAREVLDFSGSENSHVYFCPITVDFVDYLTGII
ncbi:MAG: methylenetetrahydrofolate reductase [Candidatus Omnitrophica bacterium]|nr:methylenetetrahydrofolate reductase [Candidatus Omnitrophota bacterium]